MSYPFFSICICTRNRREELIRAIESIVSSGRTDYELIVSDDSTTDETRAMMAQRYPRLQYLAGPRRGLSANRNNIIDHARGKYLLFMDDDACLAPDFLPLMREAIADAPPDTIVTGNEINNGSAIVPHDQVFLGYQNRPYESAVLNTIVINSTVFPMSLFRKIRFDENIVYGYEEVDIAIRARVRGYNIIHLPNAANFHYPSSTNRNYYMPYIEANRIYVTFKRYRYCERHPCKAFVFLIIAAVRLIAANLKGGGFSSFSTSVISIKSAVKQIKTLRYAPKAAL